MIKSEPHSGQTEYLEHYLARFSRSADRIEAKLDAIASSRPTDRWLNISIALLVAGIAVLLCLVPIVVAVPFN